MSDRGHRLHGRGVERQGFDHAGQRRHRHRQCFGRVEQRLLVLLQILGVGERQRLEDRGNGDKRSENPSRLGAHEFRGVGVPLLRHDGRPGRERVGQRDEAERRRGPEDQFLGQPRQVHGGDGRGRQDFQHEIPVGDRVDRIPHGPAEAERLRGCLPVDGKRCAGQRRRPERAFVQPLARISDAAPVPLQHLDVGEEVVAERDRLGGLQMRETRHDRAGMPVRVFQQRRLEGAQPDIEVIERVPCPQPHGGGDLVVPRARGVQAPPRRPGNFRETVLHVHVDVLEVVAPREGPRLDLRLDLGQSVGNGPVVGGADQSPVLQHRRVGPRLPDVLSPELAVERMRGIDALHEFGRSRVEPAAPHGSGRRGRLVGHGITGTRSGHGSACTRPEDTAEAPPSTAVCRNLSGRRKPSHASSHQIGVWSEGRFRARGPRSTSHAWSRSAARGERRRWSIRRPRLSSNARP